MNSSVVSVAFDFASFECQLASIVNDKVEVFKCDLRSLVEKTAADDETDDIINFTLG